MAPAGLRDAGALRVCMRSRTKGTTGPGMWVCGRVWAFGERWLAQRSGASSITRPDWAEGWGSNGIRCGQLSFTRRARYPSRWQEVPRTRPARPLGVTGFVHQPQVGGFWSGRAVRSGACCTTQRGWVGSSRSGWMGMGSWGRVWVEGMGACVALDQRCRPRSPSTGGSGSGNKVLVTR